MSTEAVFRVAIRSEGENVNAYYAPMTGMRGAILLGSIKRRLCQLPGVFESFQSLMGHVATGLAEEVLGASVKEVRFEDVPEHERAGHG